MDALFPSAIGHVGPVVAIESRGILQAFFVGIHNKALVFSVDLQGAPGNGKQLFAEAEEAAEGEHGVANSAAFDVQHEFLDAAQLFAFRVVHIVTAQRAGAE